MGTVIHLSDGQSVQLTSEAEGIIYVLAQAAHRDPPIDDQRGVLVPRGFALFQEVDGGEVWINAAQVASIRPT